MADVKGSTDAAGPVLAIDLAGIFARHERVFVAFSGGKESIVCAHLCLQWRDRVTLVWVNTGALSLSHLPAFVRGFAEQFGFTLAEVTAPDILASWLVQYADGWRDSGECAQCPASISRDRLAYLDRFYPAQASFVRQTAAGVLTVAQKRCDETAAILGLREPPP